jgi:cell division protein FtsN
MTPRDYKNNSGRPKKTQPQPRPGSWLSFISGLGVGLLIAFGVYLWSGQLPPPATLIDGVETRLQNDQPFVDDIKTSEPEMPRPKFDFYKILPEMEVPTPAWDETTVENPTTAVDSGLEEGTYLLQVGSFKRFEDADRAKANLALRGLQATIQRVVINGQDVWFRVHLGPLSDVGKIRELRMKLLENDMDFILLRIGGESAG